MSTPSDRWPLDIIQHRSCDAHRALIERNGVHVRKDPNRTVRALLFDRRCPVCDDVFEIRGNTNQRYCSPACRKHVEKYGRVA